MTNRSNDTFVSSKFNFGEGLDFIEITGKKIYGPHFKVYDQDHEIIFRLMTYFLRDSGNADSLKINLRKGLLLMGPVGCGKTSLMRIFKYILPQNLQHVMITTRNISFQFLREGHEVIRKYSEQSFAMISNNWTPRIYCFDDLGVENSLKYFGNECNVMAEILLSRYDLYISHKMLTHVTTNLTSSEIEKLYTSRVRSRMRELFNVISFSESTPDKRK